MAAHQIIDPAAVAEAQARMLPPRSARDAQRVLMCLCDPTRLKIVRALRATELAAGDHAVVKERSRSATRPPQRIHPEASAVRGVRQGNIIRYRLSDDITAEVLHDIGAAFDQLGRH